MSRPAHLSAGRARRLILAGDALAASLSVLVALSLHGRGLTAELLLATALFVGAGLVSLWAAGENDRPIGPPRAGDLIRLLLPGAVAAWLGLLVFAALGSELPVGTWVAIWLVLAALWWAVRGCASLSARRHPERVLVLGAGRVLEHLAELTTRHREAGLEIVGAINPATWHARDSSAAGHALEETLAETGASRVIVAFSEESDEDVVAILRGCDLKGVEVDIVPRLFDYVGPSPRLGAVGRLPLLGVSSHPSERAAMTTKRVFDIAVASLALVLTAPAMAAIALAVRIEDGEPVFFRQTRVGLGGQHISILKFRTMKVDADERARSLLEERSGHGEVPAAELMKSAGAEHVTRVGGFLRRFSLDELPQLWNVLRGDMSIVGPRPLPVYEAADLEAWQRIRLELRPGITGLWQVMGRSNIGWNERMELDYTYVRHWSLRSDLAILAATVGAVVTGRGAV